MPALLALSLAAAPRISCNVHALSDAEHAESAALREKLARAVRETEPLGDGYAFRVDEKVLPLTDLARWVALERRCCPFFRFSIEIEPEGGPTRLRLEGGPGVKEFIGAELGG